MLEKKGINFKNNSLAEEYLRSLKAAQKSENTIIKYRRILERFLRDCQKNLNEMEPDEVLNWLTINFGEKKERTYNLVLSVLTSFSKFCIAEEHIARKLTKNRWRTRIPKSLPKYLNNYELSCIRIEAEKFSIRDRALIALLLSSGCRRAEAASLNVEDMVIRERTAEVIGKGKKKRAIHFSDEVAVLLESYLETHPKDEPALFLNKYGQRISTMGIYQITRKLGKKARLPKSLSPHCCRHTFATTMLSKGAELEFIGEALGHNDLNVARIYARIPTEQLTSMYRKFME